MLSNTLKICMAVLVGLSLQCGIFEPNESKGSIAIVLVPEKQEQDLDKALEVLSSVRYILKKGSVTIKEDYLAKSGGYFEGTISDLEPGNDYSVEVYGLDNEGSILGWGSREGISVISGQTTTVEILWTKFRPILYSPSNGATGVSTSPTLSWSSVSGASSYSLQVSRNLSFTSFVVNRSGITETSYEVSGLSEGTTYYWRVNATGAGGMGAWSDVWHFTTFSGGGQTTIEWVTVEGGTFQMGDTFGDGDSDELPVHWVTVSTFQISRYEVTNAQYAAFLNAYGSDRVKSGEYSGEPMIYFHEWGIENINGVWRPALGYENYPVVNVTWYGADEFCRYYGYRLPTEAEWEYAARGGNLSQGYKYAGSNDVNAVAWYEGNSGRHTHPVGTKAPNELGLYDMSGNVWEWCSDWYDYGYYASSPSVNPQGPSWGWGRVIRGGSWFDVPGLVRCFERLEYVPNERIHNIGFRVARNP